MTQSVLAQETAHFSPSDQAIVADLLALAATLATPRTTPEALSDKLLTLSEAPRWVRVLVAKAALSDAAPAQVAA